MAHVYELHSKKTKKVVELKDVDDALCKHLGVEPHSENWVGNWGNTIGILLAGGLSFNKIIKLYSLKATEDVGLLNRIRKLPIEKQEEEIKKYDEHYELQVKIANFLKKNYTVKAWREF